jgi:hypothetical protein
MAITIVAQPKDLSWDDFDVTPERITDPADGTLVDALTRFHFDLPDLPAQKLGKNFALADPNAITISPVAQVFSDVLQTDELLSHEQLHYDVGIVTARSLARELMRLRAPTLAALRALMQSSSQLHLKTRAGLIQRRYDKDTNHGTISHYQRIWKNSMAGCLANERADHLMGWWL